MHFYIAFFWLFFLPYLNNCDKALFVTNYRLTATIALDIMTNNLRFLCEHKEYIKHNASVIVATGSGVVHYLLENNVGPRFQLLEIYGMQQEILEVARRSSENNPELRYMFYSSQWSWVANFSVPKRLPYGLEPLKLTLMQILQRSEENPIYEDCVEELYRNGGSSVARDCQLSTRCQWEVSKGAKYPNGIPIALRNRFMNFLDLMNCTNIFSNNEFRHAIIQDQVIYMLREVLTYWNQHNLPLSMRYHVFRKIGLAGISGYTEFFLFLPYLLQIQNADGSIGIPQDTPDTIFTLTAQSVTLLSHYLKFCILYGCFNYLLS